MNRDIIDTVSSIKYLCSFLREDRYPQTDLKMRVGEWLETFGEIRKLRNIRV